MIFESASFSRRATSFLRLPGVPRLAGRLLFARSHEVAILFFEPFLPTTRLEAPATRDDQASEAYAARASSSSTCFAETGGESNESRRVEHAHHYRGINILQYYTNLFQILFAQTLVVIPEERVSNIVSIETKVAVSFAANLLDVPQRGREARPITDEVAKPRWQEAHHGSIAEPDNFVLTVTDNGSPDFAAYPSASSAEPVGWHSPAHV